MVTLTSAILETYIWPSEYIIKWVIWPDHAPWAYACTKFNNCSISHSRDISEAKKFWWIIWHWPQPFLGGSSINYRV